MPWWAWTGWIGGGLLGLAGLGLIVRAVLLDRSRGRRRCGKCWYDMAGIAGLTCPECGRTFRSERALFRTRRHPRQAALGLAFLLAGAGAAITPKVVRDGWISVTPTPVLILVLPWFDDEADQVFASVQSRLFGPQGASALTRWERLLVARHCARKLDEGATDAAPLPPPPPSSAAYSPRLWLHSRNDGSIRYILTLHALGRDAHPAVPALVRRLRQGGPFAREAIAAALGSIGAPAADALPDLLTIAQEVPAGPGSDAAADAIAHILGDAADVRELRRLLRHERFILRVAALEGLEAVGPGAAAACDDIARAMREQRDLAGPGAAAMVAIGEPAVPALIGLLDALATPTRWAAAKALGRLGAAAGPGAPALARTLHDRDVEVRREAVRSLGQIGPPARVAFDDLLALLGREPDALVRLETIQAMGLIDRRDPRAIGGLVAALADPDAMVRNAAARALERLGPPAGAAVPTLRAVRDDLDERAFIREAAADALRSIGD